MMAVSVILNEWSYLLVGGEANQYQVSSDVMTPFLIVPTCICVLCFLSMYIHLHVSHHIIYFKQPVLDREQPGQIKG